MAIASGVGSLACPRLHLLIACDQLRSARIGRAQHERRPALIVELADGRTVPISAPGPGWTAAEAWRSCLAGEPRVAEALTHPLGGRAHLRGCRQ